MQKLRLAPVHGVTYSIWIPWRGETCALILEPYKRVVPVLWLTLLRCWIQSSIVLVHWAHLKAMCSHHVRNIMCWKQQYSFCLWVEVHFCLYNETADCRWVNQVFVLPGVVDYSVSVWVVYQLWLVCKSSVSLPALAMQNGQMCSLRSSPEACSTAQVLIHAFSLLAFQWGVCGGMYLHNISNDYWCIVRLLALWKIHLLLRSFQTMSFFSFSFLLPLILLLQSVGSPYSISQLVHLFVVLCMYIIYGFHIHFSVVYLMVQWRNCCLTMNGCVHDALTALLTQCLYFGLYVSWIHLGCQLIPT